MTKVGLVVVLLAGALAVPACAKKKKDVVPKLFCQAQFVYVQAFDGDVNNPYLWPADRQAAEALEQKLQEWHRYTLVMNRREADLVFIVRTGRMASAGNGPYPGGGPGIDAGGPPQPGGPMEAPRGGPGGPTQPGPYPGANPGASPYPGPQSGPGMSGPNGMPGPEMPGQGGVEMGPPEDWMAVYMKPGDQSKTAPIWEKSERHGLQGNLPLFLQIKNGVDEACAAAPAETPKSGK